MRIPAVGQVLAAAVLMVALLALTALSPNSAEAAHGCARQVRLAYGVGYSGIVVSRMSCRSAYRVLHAYDRRYDRRPYGYRIHWRGYTLHARKGHRRFRAYIYGVD